MKGSDRTRMGGIESRFRTTQWSEIRDLGGQSDARRREVLNGLVGRYWKPVYCYLRRKGYGNDEAKDLTQGFFQEIVLGRELSRQARQEKGRFRTFLLTALDRYVTSVRRRETAKKRRPAEGVVSLDGFEDDSYAGPVEEMRPEDAFSYVWACDIVERAIDQTRRGCIEDGKEVHWRLFEARVLGPIFTDKEGAALKELCGQMGVESATKAENMIVTVRRRFKKTVEQLVGEHIESEAEVEDELRDLLSFLER